MCGTRGRGTRGEKISMVGGKTNDDIFATNVRPKEKKKQVKQKKKKRKETYLLFHLRPAGLPSESEGGGLGKHNTHKTHTQEERLERRRGDDIEEEVYTPE